MKPSSSRFSLALVTGATSGIGLALCRLLAEKNIPLIITGRDPDRLRAAVEELSAKVGVTAIIADLGTHDGRKKIVDTIQEHVPDLVVNCAGFGLYGDALELPVHDQLAMVDVDIKSVLELSIEAARALQWFGKEGTIINVASAAAFLVFPLFATYAASKAFVTSFSESLDFELAPYKIRVLASCPGVVETGFRERAGGRHRAREVTMTASFAAEQIWKQVVQGRRVHIFDWRTRLGVFLANCFPKAIVAKILTGSVRSFKNY